MNDSVLFSFDINEDAPASPLSPQQGIEHLKSGDLTWMHLNADHEGAAACLAQIPFPDPVITEALLAEQTRPRVEVFDGGVLIILRGVNLNPDADPEDMVSLRLWVEEKRLISIQKRNLRAVRDLASRIQEQPLVHHSGDLVVQLVARLFANMEPFVTGLSVSLDEIEEDLIDNPKANPRAKVVQLRKQAIIFRRYFAPQRDVMLALKTLDAKWLSNKNMRQIQESQDRITRYVEDLDAIRERAQIVKDELSNTQAEKLNRNLYILSIISAVFLPLSFLTGLLGINVGGVPGMEDANAFWIVCNLCIIMGVIQYFILKFFRWV